MNFNVKAATNHKVVLFPNGNTSDIIEAVKYGDKLAAPYTREFSKQFKGKPVKEIARQIWHILKANIDYKIDPPGVQNIRSPGYFWKTKTGDCKSYSVFTASILKNLGIPAQYRFTGYKGDSKVKHVYIIIPRSVTGETIIIDGVWNRFNSQKPYSFKKDLPMTQISYIGNIQPQATNAQFAQADALFNFPNDHIKIDLGESDLASVTDGFIEGALELDRLSDNATVAKAIGDRAKQAQYEALHDQLLYEMEDMAMTNISGFEQNIIGFLGKKKKKKQRGKKRKTIFGKILGKVTRPVGKAVLFGPRLLIKGIMEAALPRAAPALVYALPEAGKAKLKPIGKAKREKALKFKKFLTNVIDMKGSHFDKIVRRGFQKRMGKPVSELFSTPSGASAPAVKTRATVRPRVNPKQNPRVRPRFGGPANKGLMPQIGLIPLAGISAATSMLSQMNHPEQKKDILGAIMQILDKIGKILGKNMGEPMGENDLPSIEDFEFSGRPPVINPNLNQWKSGHPVVPIVNNYAQLDANGNPTNNPLRQKPNYVTLGLIIGAGYLGLKKLKII